jgi:glycosyltransferase involved in cell wall biosynthesis
MHNIFPEAPIHTSYCSDEWRKRLDGKVVTGWLQNWPFSKLRKFLPVFRIWWFEHLDLRNFDLVISSSGNGEAKSVKRLKKGAKHICYCHSPTHFYWDKYDEYLKRPGFGVFNPLARLGLKILVGPLRKWDLKASKRPDYFIANSSFIQSKIKQYYNRESVVIHPPVAIERFVQHPTSNIQHPRNGFVSIGRLNPYKRVDIIIEACNKLGVELRASDRDIELALASATGFLFASCEDFGIVPVEAMAAGVPVIAYKAGGALDYVVPGKTGLFFEEQSVESLAKVMQEFDANKFKRTDLVAKAQEFSQANFTRKFQDFISRVLSSRV